MATLQSIMKQDLGYNEAGKRQFHSAARSALKKVADALNLSKNEYDLRSNKAGIAVSGAVTLHTDNLYVSVEQSSMGGNAHVLYRSCTDRKDYSGGHNNFCSAEELTNTDGFVEKVQRVM